MTKAFFKFTSVPNRNVDLIQRYAVLYALSRVCDDDAAVKKETIKVLCEWQRRQQKLYDAGWLSHISTSHKEYIKNCRPAFAVATPATRTCGRLICPFCYARWVREVYLKLGPKLEAAFSSGHHVVERKHVFYRPLVPEDNAQNFTPAQSLALLLQSVTSQRGGLIDMIDPAGALLYTTAEYHDDRKEWKITHRQLFKLTAWQEFPERIIASTEGRLVRHTSMTQYQTLQLVARIFRYPIGLMRSDAARTVDVLAARNATNFRGMMCYRGFRNRAS